MKGAEFWKQIEVAQGYAFVSDAIAGKAIEDADEETVRREAARRLPYARKAVEVLSRAALLSPIQAKHDGDGKIFYERDGKVVWLCEVSIEDGDAVAAAMNRYADEQPYNIQSVIGLAKELKKRACPSKLPWHAATADEMLSWAQRLQQACGVSDSSAESNQQLPTCHTCTVKSGNCAYGDLRGSQSCYDNIKGNK